MNLILFHYLAIFIKSYNTKKCQIKNKLYRTLACFASFICTFFLFVFFCSSRGLAKALTIIFHFHCKYLNTAANTKRILKPSLILTNKNKNINTKKNDQNNTKKQNLICHLSKNICYVHVKYHFDGDFWPNVHQ